MQLDDIQTIFFQECEEGLAAAETGLLACQAGEQDSETINTIFRAVHSIKGGSGAFGFSALQGFTHHFETVLDMARSGERDLTQELVFTLLAAYDILVDHVAAIRGEGDCPDDAAMIAALEAISHGEAVAVPPAEVVAEVAAPVAAEAPSNDAMDLDALIAALSISEVPVIEPRWEVMFRPRTEALIHGSEPLLVLRELISIGGEIEAVDHKDVPFLDHFDANAAYLGWTVSLPGDVTEEAIREVFEFVSDVSELSITRLDEAANVDEDDDTPPPIDLVAEASAIDAILAAVAAAPEAVEAAVPVAAPPPPSPVAATPAVAAVIAPKADQPLPKPANDPSDRAGASAKGNKLAGQTIRVDLDKLDRLVNLVGELVITQSMLSQRLLTRGLAATEELNDLDQLTRELQDGAMSIRAQPVKSVFSRVPRIVRELEANTGKRVQIEIEGETTELDKTVIEQIGEPLTHLIRNCVDHGIEMPAVRLAAGKSAEGHLSLSAEHRGGRILIVVRDDGAGINRARVLELAVSKGIVTPDAKLSDEEIDNLIFAPGFSTAKEVSNISGRGVGMDVVRQNVHALGGRISISSEPGKGTAFTMALPLTLAILDGMIVSVADQTYVIPLTHIVESLRPKPADMQAIGAGRHVLNVRGTFLPVLHVGRTLGLNGAVEDPVNAVMIVVETESFGRTVLMVDAIRDQRQVVIKSLETHYRPIQGCAGATILGDGSIALILDVEGILASRAPSRERMIA